jgi:ATP-dependent RNA helicase UAP56/SUB2
VSQFKDFGLKEELLRAVKDAAFEHPTRGGWQSLLLLKLVQMETLTNALQGEQLIC